MFACGPRTGSDCSSPEVPVRSRVCSCSGMVRPGPWRVRLDGRLRAGQPILGGWRGREHLDQSVLINGHEGVVRMSASGEWCVDGGVVSGGVDQEQGGVDGSSLAHVTGLGVSEVDMLSRIFSGECHGSGRPGEGQASVGADLLDGPLVAVLDHLSFVGLDHPVVETGDDFIPLVQRLTPGL